MFYNYIIKSNSEHGLGYSYLFVDWIIVDFSEQEGFLEPMVVDQIEENENQDEEIVLVETAALVSVRELILVQSSLRIS